MKVLQLCLNFVLPSEVFLFRQCASRGSIQSEVATINRFDEKSFPHPRIHLLKKTGVLRQVTNTLRRKAFKLDWWDRYESDGMLTDLLEELKPDLIHIHNGWTATKFENALLKTKIKKVLSLWGSDVTSAIKDVAYLGKLKNIAANSNAVIFHSQFLQNKYKAIQTLPHTQVIYPGIDIASPLTKRLAGETLKILCIARLSPVKGHKFLFESVKILTDESKNIRLTIIGDGPLRNELLGLVENLKIKDKVNFLGTQPPNSVMEAIDNHDLVVLPSVKLENGQEEAFGVSLIEAGSRGCAAIGSRTGGITEIIKNNLTGFLVEEKNPRALANAIKTYCDNRELLNTHGQNAHAFIRENFSNQFQLAKLDKLYQEII